MNDTPASQGMTWDEITAKARSVGWQYGEVFGRYRYHDWYKDVDGKRLIRGYPINGPGLMLWRKEVETQSGLSKFNPDYPAPANGGES